MDSQAIWEEIRSDRVWSELFAYILRALPTHDSAMQFMFMFNSYTYT